MKQQYDDKVSSFGQFFTPQRVSKSPKVVRTRRDTSALRRHRIETWDFSNFLLPGYMTLKVVFDYFFTI